MIDTIEFYIDNLVLTKGMFTKINNEQYLQFYKEDENKPDTEKRIYGNVDGVLSFNGDIHIRRKSNDGRTYFNGSLTKFIRGNNVETIDCKDIIDCVKTLNNYFPLKQAYITRLDIGVNVPVSQPVDRYLKCIKYIKGYKTHLYGRNTDTGFILETVEQNNSRFCWCIYDKGLESFETMKFLELTRNIVRVEYRLLNTDIIKGIINGDININNEKETLEDLLLKDDRKPTEKRCSVYNLADRDVLERFRNLFLSEYKKIPMKKETFIKVDEKLSKSELCNVLIHLLKNNDNDLHNLLDADTIKNINRSLKNCKVINDIDFSNQYVEELNNGVEYELSNDNIFSRYDFLS